MSLLAALALVIGYAKKGAFPLMQEANAARVGQADIYPDASRTPGFPSADITQDNIADNLCNKGWSTGTVRPPDDYTESLKRKQFVEYGDTASDPEASCIPKSNNSKCYEEDHLISLENGGDPKDPRNLWPEPYDTKVNGEVVGARQKDLVEGFIHDEICYSVPNHKDTSERYHPHSSISLVRGQQILATDWYACYVNMQAGKDCQ